MPRSHRAASTRRTCHAFGRRGDHAVAFAFSTPSLVRASRQGLLISWFFGHALHPPCALPSDPMSKPCGSGRTPWPRRSGGGIPRRRVRRRMLACSSAGATLSGSTRSWRRGSVILKRRMQSEYGDRTGLRDEQWFPRSLTVAALFRPARPSSAGACSRTSVSAA